MVSQRMSYRTEQFQVYQNQVVIQKNLIHFHLLQSLNATQEITLPDQKVNPVWPQSVVDPPHLDSGNTLLFLLLQDTNIQSLSYKNVFQSQPITLGIFSTNISNFPLKCVQIIYSKLESKHQIILQIKVKKFKGLSQPTLTIKSYMYQ